MRRADPVVREYARLAPRYDARWAFYVRASVEGTLERLEIREGQRVLDVGCGTGQLLGALRARGASARLVGVDASRAMLGVARSRTAVPLLAARAERLPFRDASFDWVISTSVFHYLREPRAALAEFRRILDSEGRLVITDWCDDYLACKLCDAFLRVFSRSHYRTYTRQQCRQLLGESRFAPVAIDRYRISRLWGLMTARAEVGVRP